MSARVRKVQTRTAKAEKPTLMENLKATRRPQASRKSAGFASEPVAELRAVNPTQPDVTPNAALPATKTNGAQPSMQEKQETQSVIFFDGGWYLDMYPDVREAGVDPPEHFLNHGSQEGRSPNALFDSQAYLRANPDVAEFERGPFVHYVCFGFQEKRPLR
ncbi:hypothetical protein OQ252_08025 [Acetobacter farinalis]|uniref:Glycosyl transferase n=1 Tax=Acetobacter farinalis TaxID=1260984 RepID=A0ABT3Q7S3_9PROT|nr:hypothetical protein [Acetobacter farinalis]MCX2561337.1 hypothetical protein [Acetobacter farinalis]